MHVGHEVRGNVYFMNLLQPIGSRAGSSHKSHEPATATDDELSHFSNVDGCRSPRGRDGRWRKRQEENNECSGKGK